MAKGSGGVFRRPGKTKGMSDWKFEPDHFKYFRKISSERVQSDLISISEIANAKLRDWLQKAPMVSYDEECKSWGEGMVCKYEGRRARLIEEIKDAK